jgi:hypothetical protein
MINATNSITATNSEGRARGPLRVAVCRWLLLPAAVLLGACAAAPPVGEQPARVEEDLATILSQPLDAEEYGEPRRCMSTMALRNFEPLGDRRVLFKGPGGQFWLNELRMPCAGLRSGSGLAFDSRAGLQVCELDPFVVTDAFSRPVDWRSPWYRAAPWDDGRLDRRRGGMRCTLGAFQPVSEAQVEAIRAALP